MVFVVCSSSVRRITLTLLIIGLLFFLPGCSPPSTTATPLQDQWFVSPLGDDNNDCRTPLAPCRSVSEALGRAVDGDTIYLAEGTYNEAVYVTRSVTITGELAASPVIIDGSGLNQSVVNINCWGCTVDVTLAHLTIQNGSANTGGGLTIGSADVTLRGVSVRANRASQAGGGMVVQQGATLTVEDSSIEENEALGVDAYSGGAGIYNLGTLVMTSVSVSGNQAHDRGGGLNNQGTATLTAVTFADNQTRGQAGGGALFNAGTLTIASCIFQGNQATQNGDGGAISNTGTAEITGLEAYANTASGDGGAIANLEPGQLALSESTLSSNTATFGGGIANNGGQATLSGVTVDNNTVQYSGGGVMNSNDATMNLSNVTVSGNVAGDLAGGIGNGGADATLFAFNVTIAYNSAQNLFSHDSNGGSGIHHLGGTVMFVNVLLAGNQTTNCGGWGFVASGLNLSSDASCLFDGYGNLQSTDPLLEPLANNGGTTLTHALRPDSPAIDAGTEWLAPPIDQRGVDRPVDGDMDGLLRVDIGAFEYAYVVASAETTAPAISPGFSTLVFTPREGLNCRSGPGVVYPVLASAAAGESLPAVGRDEDMIWFQVRVHGETLCWVRANLGRLEGDPAWLVLEAAPPTPTPVLPGPTDTPAPQLACHLYTSLATCEGNGCRWLDGGCHNP
ncbi:MAG: hypothetical protein JXB85_18015 [Anaerolineales bacterium]|nr:hypothetical protein [Anaerolineales bacterium]